MNWHIGQEIVCVKGGRTLTKGNIYTIKAIRQGICSCSDILLDVGIDADESVCIRCDTEGISGAWFATCVFSPLMDISELENLLNKQTNKI